MRIDKQHLKKQHKPSSSQWLRRHLNDPYVQQATKQGFRCRSAFKLQELNQKFQFIQAGMTVLDLGCAPGGWSQVAVACTQSDLQGSLGQVIGIDLLPTDALEGVTFLQGDVREDGALAFLKPYTFDVILSDMAPSLTGNAGTDRTQMEVLMEMVWQIAVDQLKPGGAMALKAYHGLLIDQLRPYFDKIRYMKPSSSRSASREIYLVALGFKGMGDDGVEPV
jgi:23S rRNA (uridine2552-2'-O)-methyltransferase